MNEEDHEKEDNENVRFLEIATPIPSLSKPTLPSNENDVCIGHFRPVNIDIIITPCDNTVDSPYEANEFVNKSQRSYKREKRKKYVRKLNWLSTYVDERRLRTAAIAKDIEQVRQLIQRDSDIDLDAGDDKQRTALHLSAANGGDAIVEMLLQNGANPNVQDARGNTPLHLAACSSKLSIVTRLLHYGADISVADSNGKTPLHLALARLNILKEYDNKFGYSSGKRKTDIQEIADLLNEYLLRVGTEEKKSEIQLLRNRLNNVSTTQEIDELGGLLLNFTQMAINDAKAANMQMLSEH